MAAKRHRPSVAALPIEVAIKIAGHLAAISERPMDDLRSLRVICSLMRRVWDEMSWNEPARYAALVPRLTLIGNPNAYFLTGIVEFFREHHGPHPSFYELSLATVGGHNVPAYLVALILYRNNGGAGDDDIAKRYVRRVEGEEDSAASSGVGPMRLSNEGCRLCRDEAGEGLSPGPVRCDFSCASGSCGVPFDWPQKTLFCNEDCRIRQEIILFQRILGIDN
ncbi:hypothetical protein SETIT_4G159300v2 [Setaria italica]|nr:hypothetical protein SETIT_4G159300v2 [Setaria italica]